MAQDLLDRITRHQIFVQRLAGGQVKEAAIRINTIKTRLEQTILQGNLDEVVEQRYQLQIDDLEQYLRATYGEVTGDFEQFGTDFIEYEAEFSAKMIGATTNAPFLPPSPDQLRSAFFTDLLSLQPSKQGRTVMAYMEQFSTDKVNQFLQAIRDGFALGQTGREIQDVTNGLLSLQRNQTESLIRTLTNHLANQARQMTFVENEDVLEGYEWISVLDSRTSFICMSRDGTVYPIGNNPEISPKPPAHFGCRSTTVPKVKREFSLFDDDERERIARGPDGKSRLIKKQSYEEWLRKQPESFQIQVLGPERQKLFKSGGLSLDRFVDPSGRTLTLDELRQLDGQFNGMDVDDINRQIRLRQQEERDVFTIRDAVSPNAPYTPDEYQEAFDLMDDELKGIAARYPKPVITTHQTSRGKDKGVYYSSRGVNGELSTNVKAKTDVDSNHTMIHEYGHHLDYMIAKKQAQDRGDVTRSAWSEASTDFKNAWTEDRKHAKLYFRKDQEKRIPELLERLFERDDRGRIVASKVEGATGLSDILDSMTLGAVYNRYGAWGHGTAYYSASNKGARYKENFANFVANYGKEGFEFIEEIAPNQARVFKALLKEIGGD